MEVSNFYKKWVRFLKKEKLYGRYLLDIQSANRLYDEENRMLRDNHNIYNFFMSYCVVKRTPFFSKKDYYDSRFTINSIVELRYHIFNLAFRFNSEESDFLHKALGNFIKLIELEKKNALPIPRSFRAKKSGSRVRGEREENSPWYSNYYQNKKQQWRR